MKSVLNKLQSLAPITGGSSHVKAPGKRLGKEKQKTNPPIQKVSNHDKSSRGAQGRKFTQLKIPMAQVFRQLREMKLLACEVPKKDYRPRGYDPKTQCDYHMGQMGHATEDC